MLVAAEQAAGKGEPIRQLQVAQGAQVAAALGAIPGVFQGRRGLLTLVVVAVVGRDQIIQLLLAAEMVVQAL